MVVRIARSSTWLITWNESMFARQPFMTDMWQSWIRRIPGRLAGSESTTFFPASTLLQSLASLIVKWRRIWRAKVFGGDAAQRQPARQIVGPRVFVGRLEPLETRIKKTDITISSYHISMDVVESLATQNPAESSRLPIDRLESRCDTTTTRGSFVPTVLRSSSQLIERRGLFVHSRVADDEDTLGLLRIHLVPLHGQCPQSSWRPINVAPRLDRMDQSRSLDTLPFQPCKRRS